jgi:hypothetical protein
MAADPLDSLRLSLMQDMLPMGLAAVDRVRKGGPQELIAAFDGSSADPLAQLRQEGEQAASQVREQLDRVSPGLGNPVMKVSVRDVDPGSDGADPPLSQEPSDPAELQRRLASVAESLRLLELRLTPDGETP